MSYRTTDFEILVDSRSAGEIVSSITEPDSAGGDDALIPEIDSIGHDAVHSSPAGTLESSSDTM